MQNLINNLQKIVFPLESIEHGYEPLLDRIGDASIVLLGEASHGTHEFYKARAEISKLLITKKNFNLIGIEGDWPDAYRVNRYIKNLESTDKDSYASLADFQRFPDWMWRNQDIVNFITWLHDFNKRQPQEKKVGFYGLDLYSLHRSMHMIIDHLEKIDKAAAQKAKERYSCFDAFIDPQKYGYFASVYPSASCRQESIDQLVALKKKEIEFFKYDQLSPLEEKFYLEQNALVVKNAEHYYRSMFGENSAHSWNIRDHHMAQTVNALLDFGKKISKQPKIIIWAHNSHVGDARATEASLRGEVNIGQLIRQEYTSKTFLLGFSTYSGTVSAASSWGGLVERKNVRPALDYSYESLFHALNIPQFMLFMHESNVADIFKEQYLQRAIGVIYKPETERLSHYYHAKIAQQFDALMHFDITKAVEPLDKTAEWQKGELPETYPFGI